MTFLFSQEIESPFVEYLLLSLQNLPALHDSGLTESALGCFLSFEDLIAKSQELILESLNLYEKYSVE